MKDLILIRGLPGAGKSTLAYVLAGTEFPVYSVDEYFTDKSGIYNFEFDKNHLAYKNCLDKTEEAMKNNISKIFIDNTFTMEWEIEPYYKLSSNYNYRVFVITVENRHKGLNAHGISNEQLKKMAAKFKVVIMPEDII